MELKNDLQITGTLSSVDQYLNFKLSNARAADPKKFPQLLAVKDMFVRGSVIRYVHVPAAEVDTGLLQDAARREAMETAKVAAAGGARR